MASISFSIDMPNRNPQERTTLANFLFASLISLFFAAAFGNASTFAVQDDPFGNPGGAQNNDPFGNADKKQEDPFGTGTVDPFGTGGTKPVIPQPGGSKIDLPKSADKVVLAIRETNPTTPTDFINALRIMYDTRNYDEAKTYLDKLIAANVSDAEAFSLIEEVGSDFIIRLMRSEEMEPSGTSFGRNLLAGANRHITSDAQLQTYFDDLTASSSTKRSNARRGFRLAGVPGLAFLVEKVAEIDPSQIELYENVAAGISSRVIPPLEAVVANGSPAQQAFAISVLGKSGAKRSVAHLIGPLFSNSSPDNVQSAAAEAFRSILGGLPTLAEAKRFLNRQVDQIIGGATPFGVDAFDKSEIWSWKPTGDLASRKVSPDLARVLLLEQYARSLYEIDPTDEANEIVYLSAQLNTLKSLGTKPVTEAVAEGDLKSVPIRKWIATLEFCLEKELFDGAVAAMEVIGSIGDESLLQISGFSPIVKALELGDRQLRYAATEALIRINPSRGFPGANRLMDSLVFFAGSRGTRRVLVAHPKVVEGQNLLGTLSTRGFDGAAATTGRGLFRLASKESDIEMMLISDAIDQPPLRELLTQIRKNPTFSRVPIGILSQKINHVRNQQIAELDPNTIAMRQPYRISFSVEQILPVDNREVNNAIITWTVLSDILEQALEQGNRSVSLQMLDTMRASYDENLSKLNVDNSVIVDAMKSDETAIRHKASKLFLRINGKKPVYEKPIEQPTVSGRVLVVHPRGAELLPLTEKLTEVGYRVAVVGSIDQALKTIPSISDLKFVIGSTEFGGLGATELRKALAKKFRLNPTPITFVDRADSYREAPVAKPVFDVQLAQLIALNGNRLTSELTRMQQARTCLQFLQQVAADRKSYDYMDPFRHESRIVSALQNPLLAGQTIPVLRELAMPKSQQALIDYASIVNASPTLRKSAVDAFAAAVKQRGLLLTKPAILKQYDRYNASESLDAETQMILGQVLDVIEGPSQKNAAK